MLLKTEVAAGLVALGFLAAGCSTPPTDLDLAREKSSMAGLYRVALVPPTETPAINQMHSWKVRVSSPAGAPVRGARFGVEGGMPQHGHGFPTKPRVTREVEGGTYLLEGMKFSMTGWWEVKLNIQSPLGQDKVTFNSIVESPGPRQ